jgi:hypothetical protein
VVHITLTVDLVTAEVEAYVVDDKIQAVPIIVGQSFLNRANVTMVLRDNQVWVFENHLAVLPAVDALPPRTVGLYAKDHVVIPPRTNAVIEICSPDGVDGDVYVDGVYRQQPGHEYSIPRCITTANGIVTIRNLAEEDLQITTAQLLARGTPCTREDPGDEVSVFSIQAKERLPFQLADILGLIGPELEEARQKEILGLINEFRNCFALDTTELGKSSTTEMHIRLLDDEPVTFRPYRLAYWERAAVREIIQDLLSNGIVRESESPYSSPIILVKKKSGEHRMCVDYRSLNAKTVKDRYPLPRIDDHLEEMVGCRYFTTLDLASGYHQIKMADDSIGKTAFVTPDGHYEFLRMPFGLVNAPAVFQRAINSILGQLRHHDAMAYLDDVLLPSVDFQKGLEKLRGIFALFQQAGMTFNLSKCRFLHTRLEYLGHEISARGIRPGQLKTRAISNYPKPTNVHEVRQFIGLTSYFRRFIRNFATIARPLTSLTKANEPFAWGHEQEQAFRTLTQC